jgi:2-dehydropantoate 2-reductase
MKILVVGAGGVGGFYGAWLLKAGRDVTFLVRAGRAEQLRERGLEVSGPGGEFTLPNPATVLAADLREHYDLIVLSCKAWDLESSMEDSAPAVGPDTGILPLLNGMAHMDILDKRFGREHVLGGDTNISAVKEPDGRIVHLNRLDRLHFGDRVDPYGERIERIAATLNVPGFTPVLRRDVEAAMWHKWVAISTAVSATCLMRATVGDIVAAGAGHYVAAILAESSSIADAEGFPVPQDFLDVTLAKFTEPGSLFTASMFRDLSAGGRIECEQIIGDLVSRGRRKGCVTPLLEVAYAHLRCYEVRRERELASAN